MIDFTKIYYFIFGALTIAGGVMGYVSKGSKASIFTAVPAGLLLILAGVLIGTKTQPDLILGLVLALLLAGRFVPAFFTKGGFMPAGLMSVLSVVGIILAVSALIKR